MSNTNREQLFQSIRHNLNQAEKHPQFPRGFLMQALRDLVALSRDSGDETQADLPSVLAAALASCPSPAKSQAARINGKLGGRPRKA
jgi:hypothetical protein